jgi:hypothetical protein
MNRWHKERGIMLRRKKVATWWPEREGIGWYRKRHPMDCGQTRCPCCHWYKWLPKGRHNSKLKAIREQLE